MEKISSEEGFEIWFQPVYSNSNKAFTSIEVLLRLKEKSGSFISPAEFIPIAENTGQIVPITWFVIEETCKALAENAELDGLSASINLPMIHLVDPGFESRLNRIVDGYGLSHERISFEFTERVILDDLDVAEKNMRKLSNSGYSFYLDDFGVGYSNFNCAMRLPLKTVKLDMSLTATTEKLKENNNLVCILTDLFHDMGLHVVAEGAETAEQVELLQKYGVDGIQGYYFAKPMPLAKLRKFLKKTTTN
jgi:EAL domain-containing protein (putative c-di-GMP-specific phosphodiesterase class I)